MKCFYHPDREAVGICSACSKGLCAGCATDMGRGLACRDRCEPEVRRLRDLRDFSFAQPTVQQQILSRTRQAHFRQGGFLLAIAAVSLAAWSVYKTHWVLLALAAPSAAYGLVTIAFAWRRQPRTDQFRLCPGCGYNLTGNVTGRCPECGRLA